MNMHFAPHKRRHKLARAVLKAAGSLLVVTEPRGTHLNKDAGAMSALRADFARIGNDMKIAAERERQREEARR